MMELYSEVFLDKLLCDFVTNFYLKLAVNVSFKAWIRTDGSTITCLACNTSPEVK